MLSLYDKLKRNMIILIDSFNSDLSFSFSFALIRALYFVSSKSRMKRMKCFCSQKLNDYIMNYLTISLKPVIYKYKDCNYEGEMTENSPIWVCWWTGEETAPLLVKKCIKSIRDNAGTHPVCLITKYNYKEYIDIPGFILSKVESKDMCIANFSDYLRVSLIRKYGGLWLDATIYCSKEIPNEYFNIPVFTCKRKGEIGKYVSDYRWTSFCLGGWKENTFYSFFQEAFECYWKSNSKAIDYLLVDYIINVAYINVPIIKEFIDNVPYNNSSIDELQAAMNKALPASSFNNIIKSDTALYKLSWREQYSDVSKFNEKSIYNYFINS